MGTDLATIHGLFLPTASQYRDTERPDPTFGNAKGDGGFSRCLVLSDDMSSVYPDPHLTRPDLSKSSSSRIWTRFLKFLAQRVSVRQDLVAFRSLGAQSEWFQAPGNTMESG